MLLKENLPLRSLKTGSLLTALTTAVLLETDHRSWAWGFLIGGLLSLLSLLSLTAIVPLLFHPNAPRSSKGILALTLFMKLPIYCLGLYLATRFPWAAPAACVPGIALAPAIVTLKTLGAVLTRQNVEPSAAAQTEAAPAQATTHSIRACPAELAAERG